MRSPERLKPQGGQFNLTPMIDMVFLLIIFFIVSNNMIQQDNAIPVELPEAESGTLPHEEYPRRLTITIQQPKTIYVGTEIVDKGRLRHIMVECRKDWGDESEIRIRTNKNIPYGEVKPILQAAAESGITRVSFAVMKRLP